MYVILMWGKRVYIKLAWLVERTVGGVRIMDELDRFWVGQILFVSFKSLVR